MMARTYAIDAQIPGNPVGKARARVVRNKHTGKTMAFTPDKTAAWEAMAVHILQRAWDGRPPLLGPVGLEIVAVAQRPKRLAKAGTGRLWRPTKCDWDNEGKAVSDALEKAGVVRNDSQVVDARVTKLYTADGEGPFVGVRVQVVNG